MFVGIYEPMYPELLYGVAAAVSRGGIIAVCSCCVAGPVVLTATGISLSIYVAGPVCHNLCLWLVSVVSKGMLVATLYCT